MAQTYTIESVSELEPSTWFDKAHNSTIYYIKVKISGHPKVVEIGKKAPDALKAGMTVYGDILPQDNPAFADKFKAVRQDTGYSGGSTGKSTYTRDDATIQAQWAIGQANTQLTALVTSGGMKADGVTWDEIEKYARQFYAMIDRVKGSDTDVKDDEPRYTDDDAQQAPGEIAF